MYKDETINLESGDPSYLFLSLYHPKFVYLPLQSWYIDGSDSERQDIVCFLVGPTCPTCVTVLVLVEPTWLIDLSTSPDLKASLLQ